VVSSGLSLSHLFAMKCGAQMSGNVSLIATIAYGILVSIKVLTKAPHFLTLESPTDDGDPSNVSDVKSERLSQAPVDRRPRQVHEPH
jgi:hypothetical protein